MPPACRAPTWILPVGGGLGYGLFDARRRRRSSRLVNGLHEIADPLTRGAALVALWEAMLEGRVTAPAMLETLIAALPRETDELNVQQMLDYTRTAFWRFTGADDRAAIAAEARAPAARRARPSDVDVGEGRMVRRASERRRSTPATVEWLEQRVAPR